MREENSNELIDLLTEVFQIVGHSHEDARNQAALFYVRINEMTIAELILNADSPENLSKEFAACKKDPEKMAVFIDTHFEPELFEKMYGDVTAVVLNGYIFSIKDKLTLEQTEQIVEVCKNV